MIRIYEKRSMIDWINELASVLETEGVEIGRQSTSRSSCELSYNNKRFAVHVKNYKYIVTDLDSGESKSFDKISDVDDFLRSEFGLR